MAARHLPLGTLQAFAAARLGRDLMIQAGRHLAVCSPCRGRLRQVAGGAGLLARLGFDEASISLADAGYEHLFEKLNERTVRRMELIKQEKDLALQRISELETLTPARRKQEIEDNPIFRSAALVDGLLETCRTCWSQDPDQAEATTHLALQLAEQLDPTLYGHGLPNDLKARGWSYLANIRRIRSDLRGADEAFSSAKLYLDEGSGDPLERARLLDLEASLRREQRRFATAIELLKEVVTIYGKTRDRHLQGRALISLASVYGYLEDPDHALDLLLQALEMIDRTIEPRLVVVILSNLVFFFLELERYREASAKLSEARERIAQFGTEDDKTRLLWMEARLDLGLARFADSEAKLQAVREDFIRREIGYNAALASLDLAKVYLLQGRTEETKRLAAEMHPIFVSRDVQREAIAALLVFQQAAERENASLRLVEEVIRSVRRAQAGPQPRPERPA
jgi:tetratricopeptide (TPR) repeat protein